MKIVIIVLVLLITIGTVEAFPKLIILTPFKLIKNVPLINWHFTVGIRLDITSPMHLVGGFLSVLVPSFINRRLTKPAFWFNIGRVWGSELSDGFNSDQGFDPIDIFFSTLGVHIAWELRK